MSIAVLWSHFDFKIFIQVVSAQRFKSIIYIEFSSKKLRCEKVVPHVYRWLAETQLLSVAITAVYEKLEFRL